MVLKFQESSEVITYISISTTKLLNKPQRIMYCFFKEECHVIHISNFHIIGVFPRVLK
jgi:hypothetical protein